MQLTESKNREEQLKLQIDKTKKVMLAAKLKISQMNGKLDQKQF